MGTATTPSEVYSPEVVAQLSSEVAMAKLGLIRTGYVKDARQSATRAGVDDTVSFPYVTDHSTAPVAVQTNARDGVAVTPDKLKVSSETANIVSKIISIENDDRALAKLAQLADPNQVMADIVGNRIGEVLESALVTTASTSTLETTAGGGATISALKRSMITHWGAKAAMAPPLVVLHSKCAYDLEASEEVSKVGVYGSILRPGEITSIAGMNFLMLDLVETEVAGDATLYSNLILMPNAIELWLEPGQAYPAQRKTSTSAWVNDWTFDYATHLARLNPKGVIVFKAPASLDAE